MTKVKSIKNFLILVGLSLGVYVGIQGYNYATMSNIGVLLFENVEALASGEGGEDKKPVGECYNKSDIIPSQFPNVIEECSGTVPYCKRREKSSCALNAKSKSCYGYVY